MTQPLSLSKTHIIFELTSGTRRAQETLEIRNNEKNYRFFKVMSTAIGRYLIRPSNGLLNPLSTTMVEILLSLSESDNEISHVKDKFAVYTIIATENITDKKELQEYFQRNKAQVQKIIFSVSLSIINAQSISFRNDIPLQNQGNSIRTGNSLDESQRRII